MLQVLIILAQIGLKKQVNCSLVAPSTFSGQPLMEYLFGSISIQIRSTTIAESWMDENTVGLEQSIAKK